MAISLDAPKIIMQVCESILKDNTNKRRSEIMKIRVYYDYAVDAIF